MLGTWQTEWRSRLGAAWQAHLVALLALWFAAGFLRPTGDPDLPRHLALAEWIIAHQALPFLEPWAWTRLGEPFYAYSWLPELAQYALYDWWGESGLRLFNAILLTAAGASIVVLGRAAGWRPWTTIIVALVHVGVASAIAGGQRPHIVLLSTVPLAWAMVYLAIERPARAAPLIALVALNAVAANSHILFPVMAAPLALLAGRPAGDRRLIALAAAATFGGWLLSPYALAWPSVFALNFGHNPLFSYPTPIAELTPGFIAAAEMRDTLGLFALGLAMLPWVVAPRLAPRERLAHGALWLGGLGVFGVAVRGVVIWWLVVIPLAAMGIELLRDPAAARVHRAQLLATYAVSALFVIAAARADGAAGRARWWERPPSLASPANGWVEPAAQWLECHAAPNAGGRLFNSFDFGDYLLWRLPGYSVSIDGRNIFPDSVARAEGYALAADGGAILGPWRGADVALVPEIYPVAAALDSASGWRRVLTIDHGRGKAGAAGLWVREDWWSTSGSSPLLGSPQRMDVWRERSYPCPRDAEGRR